MKIQKIRIINHLIFLFKLNLSLFNVVVPNQVRLELERNFSNQNLKRFNYSADLFDVHH